ncbi:MAG TPA: hypothetical protein PKD91_09140 [Bacteroidia bacterium]|nr:hypothetical protein [Bacteroidia bacterium]
MGLPDGTGADQEILILLALEWQGVESLLIVKNDIFESNKTKSMKQLSRIIILALFIISCAEKPMNTDEAKRVVEELILKIDQEDFEAVEKLYTPEFNSSEPMEIKREKLMKLKSVMGNVKAVEFISSKDVAEFGQPKKVVLEYKIAHSKITSIETFTVVEEEGGYKISSHLVKSEGN